MTRPGSVTAVLGPTNTGKTHLAIERMCAHSSGIIGFPLRLLAREVYDRVVALKGKERVALVTGEEKIVPKDARWFLCTAESMPSHDAAFVALDEAQLGADPERGHVFTDRLLRTRGRDETMILGSEALRPMVKALVPDAEIVARPRFSTLTYAGAKKISRLPKRSAIVAFSAEEVYAVAEMLRRLRGGAAVVMGALSPRTRNAQVAMFQAGEVDYLVATDAIGMGLNMDVAHVAFASLHKFDGRRQRRLTVAEMAQIAGRAGRHQRDGTFGAVTEEGPGAFGPEEVLAIEEHRFPRLEHLYWRNGEPDTGSVDALIASLEQRPDHRVLRPAPQALDLGVLKRLADEPGMRERARGGVAVARLWAACGVPDFRKVGLDPHTRFVSRLFGWLSEGTGHIPHQWFADEIARLDTVGGDVETLAGRIASVRTFAYIANRADWLADPALWAERTRAIEERLSDALHAGLTQRFVDKRTTALMRQIGTGAAALPVTIGAQGEVLVEDHPIGRLDGFRFTVASDARAGDGDCCWRRRKSGWARSGRRGRRRWWRRRMRRFRSPRSNPVPPPIAGEGLLVGRHRRRRSPGRATPSRTSPPAPLSPDRRSSWTARSTSSRRPSATRSRRGWSDGSRTSSPGMSPPFPGWRRWRATARSARACASSRVRWRRRAGCCRAARLRATSTRWRRPNASGSATRARRSARSTCSPRRCSSRRRRAGGGCCSG